MATTKDDRKIPENRQYVAELFMSKNYHQYMSEKYKNEITERTFSHQGKGTYLTYLCIPEEDYAKRLVSR